jgi:hypothetical protein
MAVRQKRTPNFNLGVLFLYEIFNSLIELHIVTLFQYMQVMQRMSKKDES